MDHQYAGMTVNERLSVSGLMAEFDKAVAGKDIEKVISILEKVGISGSNVDPILRFFKLIK